MLFSNSLKRGIKPTNIPSAYIDWDSELSTVLFHSSNIISDVSDIGSAGVDLEQTNSSFSPTLINDPLLNNKPTMKFVKANTQFLDAITTTPFNSFDLNWSFHTYCYRETDVGGYIFSGRSSSDNQSHQRLNMNRTSSTASFQQRLESGNPQLNHNVTVNNDEFVGQYGSICIISSVPNLKIYHNGILVFTYTNHIGFNANLVKDIFEVGRNNTNHLNGRIFTLRWYDVSLSDSDPLRLHQEMVTRTT
jgi:hypothetical protein